MRRDASKAGQWRWLSGALLVALVGVLALLVSPGSGAAATTFNPNAEICLGDCPSTEGDSDDNDSITSIFEVTPPDVNFEAILTFTPSECEGGLPGFYVAADADVPDGTVVGELSSGATLGTVLDYCNHALDVEFTLLEATADVNNSFTDTGKIDDASWNGFDDVGGLDKAVVQYPGFLKNHFPGVEPRARYFGKTFVSGGFDLWVILNFLVFEPGDCPSGYHCPEEWGYGSATVLNDPTEPASTASALGDFCTPLTSENTVLGTADGYALRTNPPYESTCIFRSWSRGLPDADGDGFENDTDTCPYCDNTDTDPRATRGPDNDAIDACCDGVPSGNPDPDNACWPGSPPGSTSLDCDADNYANNADNCPQVKNGPVEKNISGVGDQLDEDGDGIGDACDDDPDTIDGTRPTDTTEMPVEISGPAAPEEGTATPTATVVAVDTDGDTVTDDVEELYGSDPEDADSMPEALAYDAATCSDGVDNDGDGLTDDDDPGCAVVEETPTPTPTGEAEYCSPVFPGTYNGLVRIDGLPAASGYEVTASVGGVEWGSALVSGGRYAMDIPDHLPTAPPCFTGGTITFALDAMTCTPTEDWASGIHNVDLSCAPAAPPVTPTPEVTPTPPPAATPPVTPTALPPSGAGGLSGSSPGLPLWALALAGCVGLMTVAGLGTLVTVKRR